MSKFRVGDRVRLRIDRVPYYSGYAGRPSVILPAGMAGIIGAVDVPPVRGRGGNFNCVDVVLNGVDWRCSALDRELEPAGPSEAKKKRKGLSPPANVRSLAKDAGKSLPVVKRYWDETAKRYDGLPAQKKAKVGDKWAYIMGVVKKRLGLESFDLLLAGMPPEALCEAAVAEVAPIPNANAVSNQKRWVCPNCGTTVLAPIGQTPVCPKCREPKMGRVDEAAALTALYEEAVFGTDPDHAAPRRGAVGDAVPHP